MHTRALGTGLLFISVPKILNSIYQLDFKNKLAHRHPGIAGSAFAPIPNSSRPTQLCM
jgi:hypothetical protein